MGRKIGAITALGIGAGISVHVLYTILGFGLLIQTNELVFNAVKIISALYLIYLGLSLIRSNLKKVDPAKNEQTVEFLNDQQVPSAKSAFLKVLLPMQQILKPLYFSRNFYDSCTSIDSS